MVISWLFPDYSPAACVGRIAECNLCGKFEGPNEDSLDQALAGSYCIFAAVFFFSAVFTFFSSDKAEHEFGDNSVPMIFVCAIMAVVVAFWNDCKKGNLNLC